MNNSDIVDIEVSCDIRGTVDTCLSNQIREKCGIIRNFGRNGSI
jgi:hypothetical protein